MIEEHFLKYENNEYIDAFVIISNFFNTRSLINMAIRNLINIFGFKCLESLIVINNNGLYFNK